MPKKKESEPTFEENLRNLETIVAAMENGDMPLAELMKNYTLGVELAQKCRRALTDAEKQMDLTVGDGEPAPLILEE